MSEDEDVESRAATGQLVYWILGALFTVVTLFGGVLYAEIRAQVESLALEDRTNDARDAVQDVKIAEFSKDRDLLGMQLNKLETTVEKGFEAIDAKLDSLTREHMLDRRDSDGKRTR